MEPSPLPQLGSGEGLRGGLTSPCGQPSLPGWPSGCPQPCPSRPCPQSSQGTGRDTPVVALQMRDTCSGPRAQGSPGSAAQTPAVHPGCTEYRSCPPGVTRASVSLLRSPAGSTSAHLGKPICPSREGISGVPAAPELGRGQKSRPTGSRPWLPLEEPGLDVSPSWTSGKGRSRRGLAPWGLQGGSRQRPLPWRQHAAHLGEDGEPPRTPPPRGEAAAEPSPRGPPRPFPLRGSESSSTGQVVGTAGLGRAQPSASPSPGQGWAWTSTDPLRMFGKRAPLDWGCGGEGSTRVSGPEPAGSAEAASTVFFRGLVSQEGT